MAFGESNMSRKQVQLWYNRFKKGREDVNDSAPAPALTPDHINKPIEAEKKMILDYRLINIEKNGYFLESPNFLQITFV